MIRLTLPEAFSHLSSRRELELHIHHLAELPAALAQIDPTLARIIFESPTQWSGFLNLYLDRKLLTQLDTQPLSDQYHHLEIVVALSGG